MTEQPNLLKQRVHSLLLLFPSSKGTAMVKNLNKTFKNILPNNVKMCISYTGQKLSKKQTKT